MRSLSTASNKNSLQDSQEQQVLADQCRVLNFPAGDCEEESVDEQTLSLEYLKALEEDLQDAKSPQEFEAIRNRFFIWNAPVRGGHSGASRWGGVAGPWWEGFVNEQALSSEYLKVLEEALQDAKSPQEFEVIRNRFLWNAPVRGGHSGVSRWGGLGGHWWEGL